jgi:hypothetical protein
MEQDTEQKDDLKERADVNIVDRIADPPAFAFHKRGKDMQGNKNSHPQTANAMQDVGEVPIPSLVSQSRGKADFSFQAHSNLRSKIVLPVISSTIIYFTPLPLEMPVFAVDHGRRTIDHRLRTERYGLSSMVHGLSPSGTIS